YKWTQWVFLELFKRDLAYRKQAAVNWCPNDKTVLANEQVIAGECERCGAKVEQRYLEQWFFRITKYAERLLANLDWIDWSENTKTRSEEHTSELQSRFDLVCRLLLEKKKKKNINTNSR